MKSFFRSLLFLLLTTLLTANLTAAQASTLAQTLEFYDTPTQDGRMVPIAYQNGLPLRSFDPQTRAQVTLGGEWRKERFNALDEVTMAERDRAGQDALFAEAEGRLAADYDDSAWETITLPRVENRMPALSNSGRGPEDYPNGVWYRRTFDVPASWQDTLVTFNALSINYVVDVFVNENWVGYHEGGYTPFSLNLSRYLRYGEVNTIVLRVDNPAWGSRPDIMPSVRPDWWNYTGVIQDVYLESTHSLTVIRADALTPDLSGDVHTRTVIYNASNSTQTAELSLTVYNTLPESEAWLGDPDAWSIRGDEVTEPQVFSMDIPAGHTVVVESVVSIPNVKLWEPGAPNLYVLEAQLMTGDTFYTQFGVRTVSTDGYKLLLNGEQTFLAGIARHEEWPDTGRTASWDRIVADMQHIQSLNANFVRTAHYPNHIYTYMVMDRLGLLAAVEIPMWQATAQEYQAQAERLIADQMWREMILSNRSRPSIILWSSNNESREIPERTAYIERLQNDYRTLYDDGRLVMQSAAADSDGPADSSQTTLDVAAWTMYFGIFHGSTYYQGTADFLAAAHAAFPDKPIINTEFGIWSEGNARGEATQVEVFTETYRALSEVSAWDADGEYNPDGFVAGVTWWTMYDWYTAISGLQTMGLYEMDRTTVKPVAELVSGAYGELSPE